MSGQLISIQGTVIDLTKVYRVDPIKSDLFEIWFYIYFYSPSTRLAITTKHPDGDYLHNPQEHDEYMKKMETLRQEVINRWNKHQGIIEHLEL